MNTIRKGGRGEEERDDNWESVCHFDKSTFSNQTHTCGRREGGENGDETNGMERENTAFAKKKRSEKDEGEKEAGGMKMMKT